MLPLPGLLVMLPLPLQVPMLAPAALGRRACPARCWLASSIPPTTCEHCFTLALRAAAQRGAQQEQAGVLHDPERPVSGTHRSGGWCVCVCALPGRGGPGECAACCMSMRVCRGTHTPSCSPCVCYGMCASEGAWLSWSLLPGWVLQMPSALGVVEDARTG